MKSASFNFEVIAYYKFDLEGFGICKIIAFHQANPNSKTPGWCYAKNPYFARLLSCSERTVTRAIGKLKTDGWIDQKGEGKSRKLRAKAKFFEALEAQYELGQNGEVALNLDKMAKKPRQNGEDNLDKMAAYNKEYIYKERYKEEKTSKKDNSEWGYAEFMCFWGVDSSAPIDNAIFKNVTADDWPKIENHLPGFIKRKGPYRGTILTYLRDQKWKTDPNPNYEDNPHEHPAVQKAKFGDSPSGYIILDPQKIKIEEVPEGMPFLWMGSEQPKVKVGDRYKNHYPKKQVA